MGSCSIKIIVSFGDYARGDFHILEQHPEIEIATIKIFNLYGARKNRIFLVKLRAIVNLIIHFKLFLKSNFFISTNWRYPEISYLGRYAKIFGVKWVIMNREGFSFSTRIRRAIEERYLSNPLYGVSHVFFGNEMAHKFFSEKYPKIEANVIGYPRYDRLDEFRSQGPPSKALVAVCITDTVLSTSQFSFDEWANLFGKLIDFGFEIEIKLKQRGRYRKIEAEFIDFLKNSGLKVDWNKDVNALELISRSSFVITGYSQVIAESLALSVPCVLISSEEVCDLPLSENERLLIQFVTKDIDFSRDFCNKLCRIRSMRLTSHFGGDFLKSAIGSLNSSASEQVFETLKRLL